MHDVISLTKNTKFYFDIEINFETYVYLSSDKQ